MTNVSSAIKLLLQDLAQLSVPATASAVTGAVAAILGAFGLNFPAAAIAVVIGAVGTIAGVVEKIVTGQAAAANAAKK